MALVYVASETFTVFPTSVATAAILGDLAIAGYGHIH